MRNSAVDHKSDRHERHTAIAVRRRNELDAAANNLYLHAIASPVPSATDEKIPTPAVPAITPEQARQQVAEVTGLVPEVKPAVPAKLQVVEQQNGDLNIEEVSAAALREAKPADEMNKDIKLHAA